MKLETFLAEGVEYKFAQLRGDRELVQEIQQHLNRLGYSAGHPDGIWKPQTQAALDRFEEALGLKNPGLTPQIAKALVNANGQPTRPPVPRPIAPPPPPPLRPIAPPPSAIVPPPPKPTKRRINAAGRAIVKQYEGLRLEAYLCPAGVLTIGYGSTENVKAGQTITPQQAEALLIKDLEKFEEAVTSLVNVPLTDNQFSALVSFSFNVGANALRDSTLLTLINQRNYQDAAQQFLRWNRANGKELAGLTKRRQAERALFLSVE